ncbi:lactate utilization protein [Prolixibacteraceae bacterium Z1-6]|uniref:Lactate utilization protein n=1 Tax=Draconibacterium aestuarii TaxID=2998507 RepID=A0A9X3J759_9BACT|nr:lactate utilization protein [Prolixibacteraceae bacterium Z1-6]
MSTARQEILNKLKNAVHPQPEKPDFDAPVYFSIDQPLELAFKENLEKVNGSVTICESAEKLADGLRTLLSDIEKEHICCQEKALQELLSEHKIPFTTCEKLPKSVEAGITSCEYLVAHTGSVMVSSALNGARQSFVYPPIHILVARKEQLVDYLGTAYSKIQNKYGKNLPSLITMITGPSRTADIEKTLVLGAHGPRELHVFIY